MNRLTSLAILAAVGAAGCGSGSGTAADAPGAGNDARSLYGVYTREVTKADLDRTDGDRHDAEGFDRAPQGRYQLTLAAGQGADLLKVTDPNGFAVEMDVRLQPSELRLISYVDPERGAFCDQSVPATAEYALIRDGEAVELEPKGDGCADRDSILTGTWRRG